MTTAFNPFAKPEFLHETVRSSTISRLDKVFSGKQYDGRADWWTGMKGKNSNVFPVRERKPCVIYKLPKAAVQQVSRFLFGDGRFPVIKFDDPGLEDPEQKDAKPDTPEEKASKEATREAKANSWLADLIEQSDLKSVVQEVSMRAIATRTSVLIAELDDGKFRFTLPRAQHCWAKFEDDSPRKKVQKLLWAYLFEKEVADPNTGKPKTETHFFRREYDEQNVYFYDDVKFEQGKPVVWGAPRVEPHGLSRCPVLWIRNAPDFSEDLDGESLFEDLEDEFHALDLTLSKRHSGIVYLGSPQVVETGVKAGDGPQATVRRGGPSMFSDEFNVEYSASAPARAVGENSVWSYEGDKVQVKLLETEGKAFEVATKHVNDIRSRLLETMGVVLTAMTDTVNNTITSTKEMSARFLMLAHAPLIALVGEYRKPWWGNIREILELMITMIIDKSAAAEFVDIANTQEIVEMLESFRTAEGKFRIPRMRPIWGQFFEPSRDEILQNVTATQGALETELIAHETAVIQIAHDFSVDDTDQELEQILAERAEREQANYEATIALAEAGAMVQTQGRTKDLDQGRPDGKILQGNGSKARSSNGLPSGGRRSGKRPGTESSPKRTPGSAEGRVQGGR